jgi:hypothetical protein
LGRGEAALAAVLGVLAAIDAVSTATGGIFANLKGLGREIAGCLSSMLAMA